FAYDSKPVLRDISLRIRPGEKVLLSGANGSGKSTLVKMILGLYSPGKGEILIDGKRIEEISLSSLRDKISIVSQNTFLFADTIWNNILYSRPDASVEEVRKAAEVAGASEFIEKLEQEYETVVGEMGKRLSGGEKQKIALARALLKKAEIIIFDEAASHLDREGERRLMEIIGERFKEKTCILISHRSEDLASVDRMIRLERGRIRENISNRHPSLSR
ncbi:MAG: ATP-binding cassette domain-containing protein, partial [Acidobacteriota bacterium]|nr:ATP-binding cassette domain-containing protein [Acidobacteriota bacterium]